MKPQEALKLLDNLVSKMQLSRGDHAIVQKAVSILQEVIKPKK